MSIQAILTTVYIVWLFAVLVFLFLIWRSANGQLQRMQATLIDAATTSAQAAQKAAEAVYLLAHQEKPK